MWISGLHIGLHEPQKKPTSTHLYILSILDTKTKLTGNQKNIYRITVVYSKNAYICITNERGSSSVGRASASQAEGREFEPRFPL